MTSLRALSVLAARSLYILVDDNFLQPGFVHQNLTSASASFLTTRIRRAGKKKPQASGSQILHISVPAFAQWSGVGTEKVKAVS